MTARDELLARLAADDEFRARAVESLRAGAAYLEGGSRGSQDIPAHIRIQVSFTLAYQLRALAQALCDHARIHAAPNAVEGTCRYCEGRVAFTDAPAVTGGGS